MNLLRYITFGFVFITSKYLWINVDGQGVDARRSH